MRYKFYREHKYVSFRFNELERLIAKTDFRNPSELDKIRDAFTSLITLLEGHAHYENTALHSLLKAKQSPVYQHIEEDHQHMEEQVIHLQRLLDAISECRTEDEKIEAGYQFYLWYRKFVGDNLIHLHEEETIILPELQRLYSDAELRNVEASTYKKMTPQQIIHMMEELFPHMNQSDWEVFLSDVKNCEPEKFNIAWSSIRQTVTPDQQEYFIKKLNITTP